MGDRRPASTFVLKMRIFAMMCTATALAVDLSDGGGTWDWVFLVVALAVATATLASLVRSWSSSARSLTDREA
jgi:hypothetical protein